MKTASVRQIRLAFPALLKAVENGETVVITSHRKPVATLGPPPAAAAARKPWADLPARLAAQPARPDLDLAALLAADRDDAR
jgi:antitoxin (DNA-binding transcriptional repressor) of toxin-antitoxin stability system